MTGQTALADSPLTPAGALREAVRLIGSQPKAATILDVTQAAISKRIRKSQHAAAEWVLSLERESGISRHLLRPDLYPPSEAQAAAITPSRTSGTEVQRRSGLQLGAPAR